MLRRIANRENDSDQWVEAINAVGRKVSGRIEDQAVNAGRNLQLRWNEISDAAIFISHPFANQLPTAHRFDFQSDRHTIGGPAARCIQDVCGDSTQ